MSKRNRNTKNNKKTSAPRIVQSQASPNLAAGVLRPMMTEDLRQCEEKMAETKFKLRATEVCIPHLDNLKRDLKKVMKEYPGVDKEYTKPLFDLCETFHKQKEHWESVIEMGGEKITKLKQDISDLETDPDKVAAQHPAVARLANMLKPNADGSITVVFDNMP